MTWEEWHEKTTDERWECFKRAVDRYTETGWAWPSASMTVFQVVLYVNGTLGEEIE